jgi:hypothetical protein
MLPMFEVALHDALADEVGEEVPAQPGDAKREITAQSTMPPSWRVWAICHMK